LVLSSDTTSVVRASKSSISSRSTTSCGIVASLRSISVPAGRGASLERITCST
jgi:hypothetical protein